MKEKIKAILEKEAPLIEWGIVFGLGFEKDDSAVAPIGDKLPHEDMTGGVSAFYITGTLKSDPDNWGSCVLSVYDILDEDGNIPIIDLTGEGPTMSSGIHRAEWIGGVLLAIGDQVGVDLNRDIWGHIEANLG
jgi:hypothetical protein